MSVRIIPARGKKSGWEYDIRLRWPEGGRDRARGRCPLPAKDACKRWAEAKERAIYAEGREAFRTAQAPPIAPTVVPTLAEFWPRVVSDHYRAERKKASALDAADSIYRNHLALALGTKPLHLITTADVSSLKGALAKAAPKTVNNVLSVLSRALRCAVSWGVISSVPCTFGLLKVPDREMPFYEIDEYARLKTAAQKDCHEAYLSVVLAGSAGLRRGEIRALRWTDIDFTRRTLRVSRAFWRNVEDTPKGWRARIVPLTGELYDALKRHRHLCEFVLDTSGSNGVSNRQVRTWLSRAQARAGLSDKGDKGGIHILRHTFCSHLAMAGVSAKAIQELAGHADLKTTMRYMHLSPANRTSAIATLEKFTAGEDAPRGLAVIQA